MAQIIVIISGADYRIDALATDDRAVVSCIASIRLGGVLRVAQNN
jgi:hypothetical protein